MSEEKAIEEDKKETKKFSKGQKKKEKAKKKKEKEKAAEEGEPVSALAKIAAAKAAKHKEEEERRIKEEIERKKREEEERIRLEIEKKRKEEEEKKRIEDMKVEYQRKKKEGLILTEAEKRQKEKMEIMRKELLPQLEKQNIDRDKTKESEEAKADQSKSKGFIVSKKKKKKAINPDKKEEESKEEIKKEESKKEENVEIKKEEKEEDEDWESLLDNEQKLVKAVKHKMSIDESEEMQKEIERRKSSDAHKKMPEEEQKTKPASIPTPVEETKEEIPKYRSPILCVLGHVDTGKTKLLDKIRHTKVQESEVGGITQQIGATYFPQQTLADYAQTMKEEIEIDIKIPGLLIIDTPGHESFSNLRNRGSSLCDFAILLVDIMHGLENQTIESINILKKRKIPFVVALNKIDRCYGWKERPYASSKASYEANKQCHQQFNTLNSKVISQFAEQEINACLYWTNKEPDIFVSLVPTSAITGEGIPDIIIHIVEHIQNRMESKMLNSHQLICTVMEVKVVEGYGVTSDVILVTGELKVNDTIVVAGLEGPIVTTIRALLTPQPLKEMRVKGEFIHHERVRGSMGVKVCCPGLEEVLSGSPLYVAQSPDDIERLKKEVGEELARILKKYLSKSGSGVYVQSSTIGSLEALLELLKGNNIPISAVGLGPIHKRHMLKVLKACEKKADKEEYATVLAFEVEPDKEAKEIAEENGIKVFTAQIIYHLIDMYKKHAEDCL